MKIVEAKMLSHYWEFKKIVDNENKFNQFWNFDYLLDSQ